MTFFAGNKTYYNAKLLLFIQMEIREAEYIGSFVKEADCPKGNMPEYAFIGRSNVGKSSLINMLCAKKGLAHVSQRPGKTQCLNFFSINKSWYIVDLPGYGFAVTSKKNKEQWRLMIKEYLSKRENLQCAIVLIDVNVPPQKNDIDFINWLGKIQIPYVLAYTKTDRLKPSELQSNILAVQEALLEHWSELPQEFITSAELGTGRKELLKFVESVNVNFG